MALVHAGLLPKADDEVMLRGQGQSYLRCTPLAATARQRSTLTSDKVAVTLKLNGNPAKRAKIHAAFGAAAIVQSTSRTARSCMQSQLGYRALQMAEDNGVDKHL